MNIIVVDDHKLFRIGLREILHKSKAHRITAEFTSTAEMLDHYHGQTDDLALIDIHLDRENGLDLVRELKVRFPTLKLAVLTMHKEETIIREAVAAGVVGYFNKDIDSSELLFGLHKIEAGGRYYSAQVAEVLLSQTHVQQSQAKLPALTEREKQVLQFIVDGYSSQEIAQKMKIGKRTVDGYRASLLAKFRFKNTPQLIRFIVENRLL